MSASNACPKCSAPHLVGAQKCPLCGISLQGGRPVDREATTNIKIPTLTNVSSPVESDVTMNIRHQRRKLLIRASVAIVGIFVVRAFLSGDPKPIDLASAPTAPTRREPVAVSTSTPVSPPQLTQKVQGPPPAPLALAAVPVPAPSQAFILPVLSATEIRSRAQDKVFQLVTKIKSGTEKSSYGTAFVVQKQGVLLTNYHVVSSAILDPSKYVLELKINGAALPAKVVGLDVPNDLALIEVAHPFSAAYEFSKDAPKPGDRLYSIGTPEDTVLTIIDGLMSDLRQAGAVSRLFFSAPLNHGMSGGPVVNEHDLLVGVNDAMLVNAQNISVAIPGASAEKVALSLTPAAGRAPASTPNEWDRSMIHGQVDAVLSPWLAAWKKSLDPKGGPTLGSVHLSSAPPGAKCWQDEQKIGKDLGPIGIYICDSQDTFPITPTREGGRISLKYSWIPPHSQSGNFLQNLFSDHFSSLLKNAAGTGFSKATPSTDRAKYVCSHRYVNASSGEQLLAEYCVTEVFSGAELYDMLLTAIPIEQSNGIFSEMRVAGFSKTALVSASHLFLNSMHLRAAHD